MARYHYPALFGSIFAPRPKRVYVDPPAAERCTAVITLKDGTTADCGRRGKYDGKCWQHRGDK